MADSEVLVQSKLFNIKKILHGFIVAACSWKNFALVEVPARKGRLMLNKLFKPVEKIALEADQPENSSLIWAAIDVSYSVIPPASWETRASRTRL